ncbi:hypothetical protein [Streptomyces sp. CAU 1734]|uniref:hypothetical protein n=1 Tax=Streptomyces sp. CAU 1734 TaxID=3140360 RepID=UPI003260DDEA
MGIVVQQVSVQVLKPFVDYHGLCLQDVDDVVVPVRWPEGWSAGEFLVAREGRIDLTSAGHTHEAVMRVEVWDGEPPRGGEVWDETGEAELVSSGGGLAVWGVTGPIEETVALGEESARWRVRVCCAGRARVAELAAVDVPEGVERWLVQFWPYG